MSKGFNKSKKRNLMIKEEELNTKPGPRIIKVLTENSVSKDFEEARTEWELLGPIPSDSDEFVGNCELCNHANYIANWFIYNPGTGRTLKVGSKCIRRFIVFKGM